MRVLITTVGSRGDVQPYVALGAGLRAAGHDVTLCASVRYEPLATAHGLAFRPMTDALLDLLDSPAGRGAMEDMGGVLSALRQMPRLLRETGPVQRAMVAEAWAVAQATAPDLLVYHPKAFWTPAFGHALGVPVVFTPLVPMFVPTATAPPVGFPDLPLGGAYRRAMYRLVLALSALGTDRYLAEWRRATGVPPRPRGTDVLHTWDAAPIPVVHGFSRHVVPVPADWPATATASGYWFLDEAPDWTPPADLEAFLAAGPPPVYVGFGSMAARDVGRVTAAVVGAVQQAGVRAVLARGWGGLRPEALPASVFVLDEAPHAWLFPRVAAVVHHGGAGTTAAGLRAGRPTVVVPFFGDQPYWGRRVHALGVGPPPVPQKRLTAVSLAAAIRTAVTDPAMGQRAEAMGAAIRAENGVAAAVRRLEAVAPPSVRGRVRPG